MPAPYKVFFICTGNSARSQLAEGLAAHLGRDLLDVYSAGTMPVGVNRYAVEVMKEHGIDISRQFSKAVDEVPGPFDLVVTLCDHAAAVCPPPIADSPTTHWSIEDPSFGPGGPDAVRQAFREVRDDLEKRIKKLIEEFRSGEEINPT